MNIAKTTFGKTPAGEPVDLYLLSNSNVRMSVMTYGATVVTLEAPDRIGRMADVVLGFDSLAEYVRDNPYFGCAVGRYANRIAGGKFQLDGVTRALACNDGRNHLHGGVRGFDKVVWSAEEIRSTGAVSIRFRYTSRDGEEGYPGTLKVTMTYTLTDSSEFRIDYEAATDQPTVVNLTNHSYFNLAGPAAGSILDHEVMIGAHHFTPVGETLIPTGRLQPVEGTPMDLLRPRRVGEAMAGLAGGFDHNFVIDRKGSGLELAARVREPKSGRVMEIATTEPGIQLYSGNFLDGHHRGKGGVAYHKHGGFCLETQHYPDSPNQPAFPSTVLRPGQRYATTTVHRFSAE